MQWMLEAASAGLIRTHGRWTRKNMIWARNYSLYLTGFQSVDFTLLRPCRLLLTGGRPSISFNFIGVYGSRV